MKNKKLVGILIKKSGIILFIVCVCVVECVFAQTEISGNVRTIEKNPILSGSVILKDNTGKIVAFAYTNEAGKYTLKTEKLGQFNLVASSTGFEQKKISLTLENKSEIKRVDFILTTKITELEEVIIKSVSPITVKEDTIIFNADSFKQGNERVVEDLLKKIPGLNIDANGNIKVGNQEVEKVMIDGDDFFKKGYKILTKNMPVNPIDKVELYQHYSNNKHLKGIENSEKIALNLTLKEDAKRVWFGNMQAGYGVSSETRYETRGNLMNFGKKNKYYFLTNLNNAGEDATGDINHLIRPNMEDEIGSLGDDQMAVSFLDFGFDTPNLKKNRFNFNKAKMLSLNSTFTLSDKVKLKSIGFLNTDENNFFRNSYEKFAVGNTTFTNIEDFIGRKNQLTGFGKIELTYDISKNKTFEYTGKLNHSNENNRSDLLFNNDLLNERLTTDNKLNDQKFVFTNRFKENKVFLISGRYINEKTPQNYSINQFALANLFPEKANNTQQFSENNMQFVGLEAHLLDKKKNGNLLELKIGDQLRIDGLNSRFELFENQNSVSLPNGYQNNLSYLTNDMYLSTKYIYKLHKLSVLTQSDFHQLSNQIESFDVKTTQNAFFIVPKLGINWEIDKKNKITTSYTYKSTNAQVLDVYPSYVQTNFRSFSKGLTKLNQLNGSTGLLSYTYGNWKDELLASAIVMYTQNNDFYSTNSVITQNYSQSENIILKDRETMSLFLNFDYFLNLIKSNVKINLSLIKNNSKNIVNTSNLRYVNNLNAGYGFELRSGFSGIFNYHLGSKWNYSQIKTIIENDFTNNMSFVDLSFNISDRFDVQLKSERYVFGNLDNNKYYFIDLEARYVVKENKLTLFLSGNNLFNTETFRNYSISDINVSQTAYRLLPRYTMLKMEYRF